MKQLFITTLSIAITSLILSGCHIRFGEKGCNNDTYVNNTSTRETYKKYHKGSKVLKYHPKMTTTNNELPAFSNLTVSGNMHVSIVQGNRYSMLISGPKEACDQFEFKNNRGTLSLRIKDHYSTDGRYNLKIKITVPRITSISVSGTSTITGDNFETASGSNHIYLSASGASSISNFNFNAPKITVKTSGASKISNISCHSEAVDIHSSGASKIFMNIFAEDRTDISCSGTSYVVLSGKSGIVNCTTSGASYLNLSKFHSQTGKISSSGVSSISGINRR